MHRPIFWSVRGYTGVSFEFGKTLPLPLPSRRRWGGSGRSYPSPSPNRRWWSPALKRARGVNCLERWLTRQDDGAGGGLVGADGIGEGGVQGERGPEVRHAAHLRGDRHPWAWENGAPSQNRPNRTHTYLRKKENRKLGQICQGPTRHHLEGFPPTWGGGNRP